MKKSKKSQGNVIAVILIVLLCLFVILILWRVIFPMAKDTKEETQIRQELSKTQMGINEVSGDIANPEGDRLTIKLSRGSEEMQYVNESTYTYKINTSVNYTLDADIISVLDLTGSMQTSGYNFTDYCIMNYSSTCCSTNDCSTSPGCSVCNGNYSGNSCYINSKIYNPQYCIDNNCLNISICSADKIAGYSYLRNWSNPNMGLIYCNIDPICLTGINCSIPSVCTSIGGSPGVYRDIFNRTWNYCYSSYRINYTQSCHNTYNDLYYNNLSLGKKCKYICGGSNYSYTNILVPGKIDLTKIASKDFVNQVFQKGNHSLGIVGFKDKVYLNDTTPLTRDKNYLETFIDSRVADGGATCIACGLNEAINKLSGSTKFKVIILMTDGQANILLNGSYDKSPYNKSKTEAIDKARLAIQNNITVYTIGFGKDADNLTLQQIANIANGTYSFSDITGLSAVYNRVFQDITSRTETQVYTIYEAVKKYDFIRVIIHNDTNTYIYNTTDIPNPLETKDIIVNTGGITNINKIDVYIVVHTEDGREVSELMATWTPETEEGSDYLPSY